LTRDGDPCQRKEESACQDDKIGALSQELGSFFDRHVFTNHSYSTYSNCINNKVKLAKMNDGDEYNRAGRFGAEDMYNYSSYPALFIFKVWCMACGCCEQTEGTKRGGKDFVSTVTVGRGGEGVSPYLP
jgi:hypothetical protein